MKGDAVGGPIRWRMHLSAEPAVVFDALDSDDGRAAFWAESANERDGYIAFQFVNGMTYRSEVLERTRPRTFSLEYMGGTATFQLTSDGAGGTDLLLTHEGVTEEEWNEVHAGWLNVLFPLKGWVVHGIDLRNHDPARDWDSGFADQ